MRSAFNGCIFCKECGSEDVEVKGMKFKDYVSDSVEYLINCRSCGRSGWIGRYREVEGTETKEV